MTDAMKTAANNDQSARTGGQFEPETRIISQAMYALAEEIQSGDGAGNAACRQAAERLDAQTVEIARLRAALRTTQEPVAWIEQGLVEAGDGLVWEKGTVGHYTPLYTAPPPATPAPHQPLVVQEPVGVVESAVQGCNGFHVKLRPGQDTPRIGTKLYAAPPVVQWTAADDTEGGEA